jgi:hypothetical protein
MNPIIKLYVLGLFISFSQGNYISAQSTRYCPAYPSPFSIRQSDGSSITVHLRGDEKYSYKLLPILRTTISLFLIEYIHSYDDVNLC